MPFKPGDMLSHYRIVGKIGEGGMGLVYRAEDVALRRPAALKMLSGDARADGGQRARLLREARAAAALNHPNICTIYEVHESDEASFIAMELVEGETLGDILKRDGRLPLERLLDVALQTAEGLAAAHTQRIVHRDLKPHNIMVNRQGRVKILDFGLATPPAPPPGPTGSQGAAGRTLSTGSRSGDSAGGGGDGKIYGTIAYLSPEQALGRRVDPRSDLFSFGTLLYEMATGRSPFLAEGATATIARILEANPEPPGRLNPDLPPGLQRVIQRCLSRAPADRYKDARALLDALVQAGREAPGAAGGAPAAAAPGAAPGAPAAAAPLSATTIAVFPFAVRGSDRFAYLGEGMVDLLSTKLDGAGELRCVDAHVMLGSLAPESRQPPAPERAQALAERFGAGLFVLGNILEAGGELHLNASLFESCAGALVVARGSVRGDAARIFDMVDDLTTQLLTNRCGGPGTRFTRIAAVATGSFPALKAYLEGEAEMRAMRRVPAVEAYRRSTAADPGFALAWYRMSVAALWSGQPDLACEAAREAARHRDRLSQRDGRLLEAFQAVLRGANDEAERLYRALLGAHPDDVEAWYQLGEILFHSGPLRGRPIADSRDVWERVLSLDGAHVNALVHLGAILASDGDRDGIERVVGRVVGLSPAGDAALSMRAMRAFALGAAAERDGVVAELRRAGDHPINWAIRFVGAFLGDLEAGGRLASLLTDPVRSADTRALGHVLRAHFDLARGRVASMISEIDHAAPLDGDLALVYGALLAAAPFVAAPPERLLGLRADLERWEPSAADPPHALISGLVPHAGLRPHLRLYLIGLLSDRLGDGGTAAARAADLEALSPPAGPGDLVSELALGLRARAVWASGRREEALALFERGRGEVRFDLTFQSPFYSRTHERFTLAEWLAAFGREREALRWLSSFEGGSVYDLVYASPAHLRRGAIHERLGDARQAAGHYRRFIAAWRDCDEPLRPMRAAAEAGLARLGGGSA